MAEGADVTVHVEPEPVTVQTDTGVDLALVVGRIDGSLTSIVERLSNVESRQEQLWNAEQARAAAPPITVVETPEPEPEPEDGLVALELETEEAEPSETESAPEASPKHQHKTVWDHL